MFTRILMALALVASSAGAAPVVLMQHGRLLTTGDEAVNATVQVAFKLSKREQPPSDGGETFLWSQAATGITVAKGFFSARLGGGSDPLDSSLFQTNDELWLAIFVDGVALSPRLRVTSAPYAVAAGALECDGCVKTKHLDPAIFSALDAVTVGGLSASATPAAGKLFPLDSNGKLPQAVLPALDAATVGGLSASATPAAGKLFALDSNGKLPDSVLPTLDAATVGGLSASATPAAGKLFALDSNGKVPASALPAIDAVTISGFSASATPTAGKLLVLDSTGHVPLSVLPSGPSGLDAATVKGHEPSKATGTGKLLVLEDDGTIPTTLVPPSVKTDVIEGDVDPSAPTPYLKLTLPTTGTKIVSAQGYVFDPGDNAWKVTGRPVTVKLNANGALPNGLVAYWKFDETGTGPRDDSGPSKFRLAEQGSGGVLSIDGKFGKAARMTGNQNLFMDLSNYSATQLANGGAQRSWTVWTRRNAGTHAAVFAEHAGLSDTWRHGLWYDNNGTTYYYFGGTATNVSGLPAIGEWHHYAGVTDGTTSKLYLDGTVVGTYNCGTCNAQGGGNTSGGFWVGCHAGASNCPSYRYQGDVDELSIFNRPLTSTEIRSIMDNGVDGGVTQVDRLEIQQVGQEVRLVNKERGKLKLRLSVTY